ncbi:MAG TPA: paraquat-inducible protein A [Candidatus Ozemobacteraceae bacterium]|nr:paraquat-inducible protein A [Candidatus Ozemobacteraceae bacterium]HQG27783.1 paraquat-inducible protein A [Candidatus Ozemobacteraceae bacterium]
MSERTVRERDIACRVCGQINAIPASVPEGSEACCTRCGGNLDVFFDPRAATVRTLVLCGISLLFLVPGLYLPLLKIEKFGIVYETGIIMGVVDLVESGQWFLAGLIAVFSVIFPLLKSFCMFFLCVFGSRIRPSFRRHLHLFIEVVGRWGTLDVLLLAVLVAIAKMRNILLITSGPGAIVFSTGVFLNLAASQSFSPRILWEADEKDES